MRKKATDVAFAGLVKPEWSENPQVISAPTPQSPYDKIMATAKPPPPSSGALDYRRGGIFKFLLENARVGSCNSNGGEERRAAGLASRRARASPEITVASAVSQCLQQQPSPTSTDWAPWLEEDGVVRCHAQRRASSASAGPVGATLRGRRRWDGVHVRSVGPLPRIGAIA